MSWRSQQPSPNSPKTDDLLKPAIKSSEGKHVRKEERVKTSIKESERESGEGEERVEKSVNRDNGDSKREKKEV